LRDLFGLRVSKVSDSISLIQLPRSYNGVPSPTIALSEVLPDSIIFHGVVKCFQTLQPQDIIDVRELLNTGCGRQVLSRARARITGSTDILRVPDQGLLFNRGCFNNSKANNL